MKNSILKTVLFAAMALFISATSFAISTEKGIDVQTSNSELVALDDVGVDLWITSKEGCRFHIVGDANLWSGTFTGTVTGTSDHPCPKGEWTFGISTPGGDIVISGEEEIVDFMNGDPDLVYEMAQRMGLVE